MMGNLWSTDNRGKVTRSMRAFWCLTLIGWPINPLISPF